jgi:AcrR family transcriptional regulator
VTLTRTPLRHAATPAVGIRGHRFQNPERAEARRREILLAAARVFATLGYDGATLDDVAEGFGATKAVIYYYFRSKEEIYTEIRATAIRDGIERLEAIVARGEPPELTLRALITDLVTHIFEDLDRYATILRARRLSDASHQRVRTLQRHYERVVREVVERGMRAGVFVRRDAKLTTFVILRGCLGVADWYSPDGPLSRETITQQVTDQMLASVRQVKTSKT